MSAAQSIPSNPIWLIFSRMIYLAEHQEHPLAIAHRFPSNRSSAISAAYVRPARLRERAEADDPRAPQRGTITRQRHLVIERCLPAQLGKIPPYGRGEYVNTQ